uniref:SAM domain, SH3 domain and nuclear localisation signals 1a n=1 Tax=Paramormyrops kingsleyae TaxID=1676925 RepID=A0A3B3RQ31_9TELE
MSALHSFSISICKMLIALIFSQRSTSFGKFEAFKHHPSPVKTEEGGTGEHDEKSGDESDQSKAGSLGKKMRAISLTMRMKMHKKHPKAADVTSEDVEGDHEDEVGSHHHSEEEHLKTNSVESLNGGVTSGSNPSSNRDSLRHEHDGPYTGSFCGRARVHTNFVPSPYDTDSLKLKEGDIIDIISKTPMGIWTGMLNNKVGTFKFIYVDLIAEKVTEEPKIRRNRRSKRPRPKTLLELLERLNLEEYASSLLLNGYQTVEDLKDLKEKHLIELNVTDPEHRQKLLAAAECLQYSENDNHLESEDAPSDCQKPEPSEYPRDSGCYVSSECSDNGKEDCDSQQS